MSVTGSAIRLEIGRSMRTPEGEPWLVEFTNTSTTAGQVTDAIELAGTSRFTSQSFAKHTLRCTTEGNKTAAIQLTPSTGVLTFSPSYTPTTAHAYECWHPSIDPDAIDRARDRALTQNCYRKRLEPLCIATDGDFEDSGVTSWTGSSATPTKTSKAGAERFTDQGLRVLNTGANGYAAQTVDVTPEEQYTVFVYVEATVGTAALILYDVTNAAVISLTSWERSTWANRSFGVITGTVTMPAGCKQVSVRFGGQGASDDTFWAGFCFYPSDTRMLPLPARLINTKMVGEWFEISGDEWPEVEPVPLDPQPEVRDVGGGGVMVDFQHAVGGKAIFYDEFANYSALQTTYTTTAGRAAGDAATTNCALEYIKWATLYQMFPLLYEKKLNEMHRKYAPQRDVRRVLADAGLPVA